MIGNKGSRNKAFTPLRNQKFLTGFTLIELLVVISIIGLLSAIVIVGFDKAKANARDAKRATDMAQITKALKMYASDNNSQYPQAGSGDFCYDTCSGQWTQDFQYALVPNYITKLPVDPLNDECIDHYYTYCRNQWGGREGNCRDKLVLWTRVENPNYPGLKQDCTEFAGVSYTQIVDK